MELKVYEGGTNVADTVIHKLRRVQPNSDEENCEQRTCCFVFKY